MGGVPAIRSFLGEEMLLSDSVHVLTCPASTWTETLSNCKMCTTTTHIHILPATEGSDGSAHVGTRWTGWMSMDGMDVHGRLGIYVPTCASVGQQMCTA
jgi:hypothetical protein